MQTGEGGGTWYFSPFTRDGSRFSLAEIELDIGRLVFGDKNVHS